MYIVHTELLVKFIYSEKATNFCEIATVDLSYVVTVKSTVEISQNCVAFSEYMNFIRPGSWLVNWGIVTKGQLISKGLFGILNSSKKQTKKFDITTMVLQVDLFSFGFFGRI